MPAKRSKVTCIAEERHDLLAVISQGKAAAHKLTRARIRLQADQGPQGPAWSDAQGQQELHGGRVMVERSGKACVAQGIEAALRRKQRAIPGMQQCEGATEAQLLAEACSSLPQVPQRW